MSINTEGNAWRLSATLHVKVVCSHQQFQRDLRRHLELWDVLARPVGDATPDQSMASLTINI
jgi:hypothetical protein